MGDASRCFGAYSPVRAYYEGEWSVAVINGIEDCDEY